MVYGRYNEPVFMGIISWFINQHSHHWGAPSCTSWEFFQSFELYNNRGNLLWYWACNIYDDPPEWPTYPLAFAAIFGSPLHRYRFRSMDLWRILLLLSAACARCLATGDIPSRFHSHQKSGAWGPTLIRCNLCHAMSEATPGSSGCEIPTTLATLFIPWWHPILDTVS